MKNNEEEEEEEEGEEREEGRGIGMEQSHVLTAPLSACHRALTHGQPSLT